MDENDVKSARRLKNVAQHLQVRRSEEVLHIHDGLMKPVDIS